MRPTFYGLDDQWDKMIIPIDGDVRYPTQNGIFILAAARRFLRSKILEIKRSNPNLKVVYSDTDSLIIPLDSLSSDISKHIGKSFGQLSDSIEGIGGIRPYEVIIAGKKMYGYAYNDADGFPRQVVKIKGINRNMTSIDHLKHILKDVDHEIQYKLMTMKRNITNVRVLETIRRIKAKF